ncbi:MAG: hypothetical protein A2W19_03540 [Spirochaetes bacterium RBG_16_49_21]|nr:MAG: hypothetical protein A2W19_03540 [Spirochaetes bacterium RBG_16_49_21]
MIGMSQQENHHYKKRMAELWEDWKQKHDPADMTDVQATNNEEKFYVWAERIIEDEWDKLKE